MNATKLKAGFRQRWNQEERVAGWTGSGLNAEFTHPVCRRLWKTALRQAVKGVPAGTALDVGTGPGTIAQFWAELGFRTTGVDFAPLMLAAGRTAAAQKGLDIAFVEGDAEAPPFPPRKFDVVSSRFVLFTLPHPGYAMRRWVELLRPGGCIVLIGHDRPADGKFGPPRPRPKRKMEPRHQEALRQLPFADHSGGDLMVVLEAAGLRDIRRITMDKLVTARQALSAGPRAGGGFHSTPFIVVGRKAS
ncbi:MAG TPA: class I SAM-dependent methyltransferase [Dongiaceae bacterium]|nr:class I SAM-dependent methyltransferase [Dongiaceae bacterium]